MYRDADSINKVRIQDEIRIDTKPEYEFQVYQNGELVYKNKSHCGVVCTVERISDIDDIGAVDGITQKFIFGHPVAVWYAFNQLEQNMEGRKVQMMVALNELIQSKSRIPQATKDSIKAMTNYMTS
jgi:hypothetical protein